MAGDITSAAWVSVLQPGTANVIVLLIDDMLDVLALFLDPICHKNSTDTSAYAENLDLPVLGVRDDNIGDLILTSV